MSKQYSFPEAAERQEVLHETKDGLRYFGAMRMNSASSGAASDMMIQLSASIALLKANSSREVVTDLLSDGWDVRERLSERILERVCAADGLFVDVFGFFDDPEVSVIVYGQRSFFRP